MSASWFDVYFSGAIIGRSLYHNTSDVWFTGIVPEEAGKAGYSYAGLSRHCTHDDSHISKPLHWVSLVDRDARPLRTRHTMLACLLCQALVLPGWNDDGYGYLPYSPEILARAVNEPDPYSSDSSDLEDARHCLRHHCAGIDCDSNRLVAALDRLNGGKP